MPKIVMSENSKRNVQFTTNECKSPKNPIIEFIDMITNDVPTARFMVNPAQSTNAGTYKKPPPAPIKPVIMPIIIP